MASATSTQKSRCQLLRPKLRPESPLDASASPCEVIVCPLSLYTLFCTIHWLCLASYAKCCKKAVTLDSSRHLMLVYLWLRTFSKRFGCSKQITVFIWGNFRREEIDSRTSEIIPLWELPAGPPVVRCDAHATATGIPARGRFYLCWLSLLCLCPVQAHVMTDSTLL